VFLFLLLSPSARLLDDDGLLTAQDCTRATHCAHLEVSAVVALKQRVPDRLEGLARVALQLNATVVLRWLPHAAPVARDKHDSLAAGRGLHSDAALLHQTVVAQ